MNLKPQADKLYKNLILDVPLIRLCEYSVWKLKENKKEGEVFDFKFIYSRKRKVYPYLTKEGKINWFNALTGGTWLKLGILIGAIILISLFLYDWSNAIKVGNECLNNTIVPTIKPYLNISLP